MNKPNILFIITDHQAWHGHFTAGGIAPIKLPVWEKFCEQGVQFERAYCSAPICTPSRSSMIVLRDSMERRLIRTPSSSFSS